MRPSLLLGVFEASASELKWWGIREFGGSLDF